MKENWAFLPLLRHDGTYNLPHPFLPTYRFAVREIANGVLEVSDPSMALVIYDIPYQPDPAGLWHVQLNGVARENFDTRVAAIAYAVQQSKVLGTQNAVQVLVSVEGADGIWREFESNAKRPVNR